MSHTERKRGFGAEDPSFSRICPALRFGWQNWTLMAAQNLPALDKADRKQSRCWDRIFRSQAYIHCVDLGLGRSVFYSAFIQGSKPNWLVWETLLIYVFSEVVCVDRLLYPSRFTRLGKRGLWKICVQKGHWIWLGRELLTWTNSAWSFIGYFQS